MTSTSGPPARSRSRSTTVVLRVTRFTCHPRRPGGIAVTSAGTGSARWLCARMLISRSGLQGDHLCCLPAPGEVEVGLVEVGLGLGTDPVMLGHEDSLAEAELPAALADVGSHRRLRSPCPQLAGHQRGCRPPTRVLLGRSRQGDRGQPAGSPATIWRGRARLGGNPVQCIKPNPRSVHGTQGETSHPLTAGTG